MLILTRKTGESIFLDTDNGRIEMKFVDTRDGRMKIAFDAPQSVNIVRGELLTRKANGNTL